MKRKLAVPKGSIFDDFISKADKISEIEIIRASEKQCAELLVNDIVDLALLTPYSYGKNYKIADFRIIPGPCFAAEGYTGLATICLRQGISGIDSCLVDSYDDFLILIARILIEEKFGVKPKYITRPELNETGKYPDVTVCWGKKAGEGISLDVSGEWFDQFEKILPLAFWGCKCEDCDLDELTELLSTISDAKFMFRDGRIEIQSRDRELYPENGKMILKWGDDVESSLEAMLENLFYFMHFADIPAVKILGRDKSPL